MKTSSKKSNTEPPGPIPVDNRKQKSANQISNMLERVSDAIVALDSDWIYTYVNKKAAQAFGRTPDQMIGKHIWTEFPEGIGQPFYKAYYRAVETQQVITLEEYYPPYDRWFENRIYPSKDGLTILFNDITERKKAEQAFRDTNLYSRKPLLIPWQIPFPLSFLFMIWRLKAIFIRTMESSNYFNIRPRKF